MNNFKNYFLSAFFLLCVNVTYSQDVEDKIKTYKIGYITQELNLTSDEATKFWPVYNEYESKKMAILKRLRVLRKGETGNNDGAKINEYLSIRRDMLNIEEGYIKKFRDVLPDSKVVRLLTIEDAFKEKLAERANKGIRQKRGKGE